MIQKFEDKLNDLADSFKLFGDATRVKILFALLDGEKNVGELAEALSMNQSAISHQLSTLKAGDLVRARRDKKAMYYSLADDHVERILQLGMEHVCEEE